MHYYQFNIGDYASATAHLEPLEDLAYRRLLDLYYSNEQPIPEDLNQTSRLIRMRTYCDCIATVLDDFFILESDGWHCDRVDVEIFKYLEKSHKASKSAKVRWKKIKQKQKDKILCERIANAVETHSERSANQEPLNTNQEPLNTIKDNTSDSRSRFNEFWDLYNKKIDSKKCKDKFKKLTKSEIELLFLNLSKYIESTPNIQYRKNPLTWLNGKCWNDEFTINKSEGLSLGDSGDWHKGPNNLPDY